MKIAVLTSSRADYGIYLPLLRALKNDPFFDLRLLVFGTHLSSFHGYTIQQIEKDEFRIDHKIEHILASDSAESISTSMALTSMKFANVWANEKANYDLAICLGDRYEMFAASCAAVPFSIPFAHIHGGETTLGAIDNTFRHSLSLFSRLHFVATEMYAERVKNLIDDKDNVFTVGALSLDNLDEVSLLSVDSFHVKYQIDLSKPTLLVTYHPETIAVERNAHNAIELLKALDTFNNYQIIITMPNADTAGNTMREFYKKYGNERRNVYLIENFGTQGYFSCMNLCSLVIGNSSSGIIEAASFRKYVIDIGSRQKGRAVSDNVIHCEADSVSIIDACQRGLSSGTYCGTNIYYKGGAVRKIVEVLKKWEA